jgi:ribosomal protein L37AE/L43A
MSFIKQGISFQNQAVVDIIDNKETCEKCHKKLNLLNSSDGIVICDNCGYENKIKDM